MAVTLEDTLRHLKDEFQEALKAEGITPTLMAKKLREELDATETKVFNDKSGIKYSEPLIAWKIRQQARIDAQRLLNLYPNEDGTEGDRDKLGELGEILKQGPVKRGESGT